MSENISRRATLATTGRAAVAVLAGGGVAVSVPSDADAGLHRLEAEFKEAHRRWLDEDEDYQEANERLEADFPVPVLPAPTASDDAWTAYLDAFHARMDESDRRGIRFGDYRSVEALAYRMLAIPAVTLPGIMVKVRLGAWFEDGDEEGMAEMHKSVIADLEAMTGAQS